MGKFNLYIMILFKKIKLTFGFQNDKRTFTSKTAFKNYSEV